MAIEAARAKPAILVTGGAGYIGSHAVLELLDAGYPTVVIDNLVTGFRWAVDPRAVFVEGAIDDDALVRRTIREHNIAGVLHFAGSTVAPESVSDPLKYYRNNTAASRSLLESVTGEGVRHFVFSSTAAVYGITPDRPVTERDRLEPETPYGRSKLMTERMLADIAAAKADFNYCALRYFNVAGADALGRAGPSGIGATHLMKAAVEVAVGKREALIVHGDDFATHDGTGVRDYIHVSDLAAVHILALQRLFEDPSASHVLNCGYGRGHSVLDVVGAVSEAAGRQIPYVVGGRRPGDLGSVVADNALIRNEFAWRPRFDELSVIVADALRWEQELDRRRA